MHVSLVNGFGPLFFIRGTLVSLCRFQLHIVHRLRVSERGYMVFFKINRNPFCKHNETQIIKYEFLPPMLNIFVVQSPDSKIGNYFLFYLFIYLLNGSLRGVI